MNKKIFRIFIAQLIIVSAVFFYFYHRYIKDKSESINIPKITSKKEMKSVPQNKIDTYGKLEEVLLNGETEIYIKNYSKYKDPHEIFHVLEQISLTNPKVMYYKGGEYSLGKISISYSIDIEDMKKHQNEIEIVREKFIRENIIEDMSDYEKILMAHDYIIINSSYDRRLEKYGSVPPESHSSYGILSLGIGVCEGYAKAMKFLLDGLDIESMIVVGSSRGGNHAWNLVNIDGEYYHIDTTWNDPVTVDGSQVLRYNYFNLVDNEISKSHSWNREDYPFANSDKYNYFNYNDLVVEDKKGLEDKLKNILGLRKDDFSIKILNYDNIDIEVDRIIEKIIYSNQNLIKLKSYSYSLDEDQGIINFKFSYY